MTVDELARDDIARAIALVDGINLDWIPDRASGHWHRYQVRALRAIEAYEAAKPVPASGGVEAVRLVLEDIKASADAHSVGWVKHRAAQALLALASSTPPATAPDAAAEISAMLPVGGE